MKKKNSLSTEETLIKEKWLQEINQQTMKDHVEKIDINKNNVREIFQINYRNWVYVTYYENFMEDHPVNVLSNISKNYEDGLPVCDDKFNYLTSIYEFVRFELEQIEQNDFEDQTEDIKTKINTYLEFLEENELRFWRINRLMRMMMEEKNYKSLIRYAKGKINFHDMDGSKLDLDQMKLFYLIDRIYLLNLIRFKEEEGLNDRLENVNRIFDFEYYKNPPIYLEFPREKLKYLKALKSWFVNEIERRKKIFDLTNLPLEYKFLMDYANSLVPPEKRPAKLTSPVLTLFESEVKLNTTPNFPFHVFKNYQSFQLFTHWSEHFNSKAQMAFIFRMMSEVENPPLILLKDTPFREWMNQHQEEIKLESHTLTLPNAKNDDRLAAYAMLKSFIFKDS